MRKLVLFFSIFSFAITNCGNEQNTVSNTDLNADESLAEEKPKIEDDKGTEEKEPESKTLADTKPEKIEPEPEEIKTPPVKVWLSPENINDECLNQEIDFDLDSSKSEMNKKNAFWMMWFTLRSFHFGNEKIKKELKSMGFKDYKEFDNKTTGLQALLISSDTEIILTFRGTIDVQDWFSNFTYGTQDGANLGFKGKVHTGFSTMLETEWSNISGEIKKFYNGKQKVLVSGHSLGGALAHLAAAKLINEGYDVPFLYTFASPRVGNKDFANWLNTQVKLYRFDLEQDMVPHLAPTAKASPTVGSLLPFVGKTLSDDLIAHDYTHSGSSYLIFGSSFVELLRETDEQSDEYYWNSFIGGNFNQLLLTDTGQAKIHTENYYTCRLYDIAYIAKP